jgi:hypothetical protein
LEKPDALLKPGVQLLLARKRRVKSKRGSVLMIEPRTRERHPFKP